MSESIPPRGSRRRESGRTRAKRLIEQKPDEEDRHEQRDGLDRKCSAITDALGEAAADAAAHDFANWLEFGKHVHDAERIDGELIVFVVLQDYNEGE